MLCLLAYLALMSFPCHRGQEQTTRSPAYFWTTIEGQKHSVIDEQSPREDPGYFPWQTTESPYANLEWPGGTFGLPATDSDTSEGCPDKTFELSMRAIRTQYLRNQDKYYEPNNMKGKKKKKTLEYPYMVDFFCTRFVSKGNGKFPRGSYCVNMAKANNCPPHMSSGYIQFDSPAGSFSKYGRTPHGRFGENTRYYYCCMTDPHDGVPKTFPAKVPFFLYRRGDKCEPVNGMDVQLQVVQYDTRDTNIWTSNCDQHGGVTPDHTLNDIVLYLCYYYPHKGMVFYSGSIGRPWWQFIWPGRSDARRSTDDA